MEEESWKDSYRVRKGMWKVLLGKMLLFCRPSNLDTERKIVMGKKHLLFSSDKIVYLKQKCKHRFYFSALFYSNGNNNTGATKRVVNKPNLGSQRCCREAKKHTFSMEDLEILQIPNYFPDEL